MNSQLTIELAAKSNIKINGYYVNRGEFLKFFDRWQYSKLYKNNAMEKSLEHFVSMQLLYFNDEDIYIDIASSYSKFPEIIRQIYNIRVYEQDLCYSLGVKGQIVGGDACKLPFPDNFFSKMALHCSFEHFEKDADSRFIKEAARVLKPGGMLCILPLYLSNTYFNLTDPTIDRTGIEFDKNATIKESVGWANRFARHYSVDKFKERVLDHCNGLTPSIYVLENGKEVDESCYLKYIFVAEKIYTNNIVKQNNTSIRQYDNNLNIINDQTTQPEINPSILYLWPNNATAWNVFDDIVIIHKDNNCDMSINGVNLTGIAKAGTWSFARTTQVAISSHKYYKISGYMLIESISEGGSNLKCELWQHGDWLNNFESNRYDMNQKGSWQKLIAIVSAPSDDYLSLSVAIEKRPMENAIAVNMYVKDIKLEMINQHLPDRIVERQSP